VSGFRRGDGGTDVLRYCVSEECFPGFEEGRAWAVADPVEVGICGHAERTVCVFGFILGICCVQGVPGAVYVPACDEFHDSGGSSVGSLREFPYGEGEAAEALFVGQVVEGVRIPAEYDGG
jgi:hypothetical protein